MYIRALAGFEKAIGPDHKVALGTVYNLGCLYADQGKLAEVEEMYARALAGVENVLGENHYSTVNVMRELRQRYRQ